MATVMATVMVMVMVMGMAMGIVMVMIILTTIMIKVDIRKCIRMNNTRTNIKICYDEKKSLPIFNYYIIGPMGNHTSVAMKYKDSFAKQSKNFIFSCLLYIALVFLLHIHGVH